MDNNAQRKVCEVEGVNFKQRTCALHGSCYMCVMPGERMIVERERDNEYSEHGIYSEFTLL